MSDHGTGAGPEATPTDDAEARVALAAGGPLVEAEPVEGTSTFSRAPSAVLAVRQASEGLGVYAVASGLAAAFPVPFLDEWLGPAVRGSALRKVAQRHGVRLTPEAREVLARAGGGEVRRRLEGRVARELLRRLLRPLRLVSRFEDAGYTMATALLLDHYLAHAPRRAGAPLDRPEAERVRAAMEAAMVEGLWSGLRAGPLGLLETARAAAGAVFRADDAEGRNPVERLVDGLLDGAADAPDGLRGRLTDAFDAAWARRSGAVDAPT